MNAKWREFRSLIIPLIIKVYRKYSIAFLIVNAITSQAKDAESICSLLIRSFSSSTEMSELISKIYLGTKERYIYLLKVNSFNNLTRIWAIL